VFGTKVIMSDDLDSNQPSFFDANTAKTLKDIELIVDMVSFKNKK
jgi:putative methionine-R-sulfoxide reductase with GAF domain